MDTGSHIFDLLLWWIGDFVRLESYEDDAWGGVEANARLRIVFDHRGKEIPGVIEISADRILQNTVRIYGSRGWAELSDSNTVQLQLQGSDMILPVEAYAQVRGCNPSVEEVDNFVRQLEWFVAAVCGQDSPYVDGRQAIRSLAIIETCYRQRQLWLHPWEAKFCDPVNLQRFGAAVTSITVPAENARTMPYPTIGR